MNDLKDFWDSKRQKGAYFTRGENAPLIRKELGLFFWERGGKRFCELGYCVLISESEFDESQPELKEYIGLAKSYNDNATKEMIENARDFLDCLACLGEDKVKELLQGESK